MSYAKKSIKEYFFVAIVSIAIGQMLIIIGGISEALSELVFYGWLSSLLLPILSWYTIYTKDVKLGDYISKLTGGTIVFIVCGIILIIIGIIVEGFEEREGFLGLIITLFKLIGSIFTFGGFLTLVFSPIISWYYFQKDKW